MTDSLPVNTATTNMLAGRTAFVSLLASEGVALMFGNPGTTELAIMQALTEQSQIGYVLGLQESIVVGMADGYARASGRLAACNVHVAPGLGNALGALYNAKFFGSPVLVTAGQQEQGFGLTEPMLYDALVPMAAQPTQMASRNWMMRRLIIDAVRNDPDWKGGDSTTQPKAVQVANVFYGIATNGGTLAFQAMAPTREKADALLDARLKSAWTADANNFMYQWDASRDYNASGGLDKIKATVLAINSADDERNPPETGIMDRELKKVKNARLLLIPASADTRGHGTTSLAKFWGGELAAVLAAAPRGGRN